MKYLKITSQKQKSIYKLEYKETFFKKVIHKVLKFFFAANPDFDGKIKEINIWLLEFEDEESTVVREIGLDEDSNVIMKMPYKKNYGYWSDVDMSYLDYIKRFRNESISKEYFEEKWNELK